MRSTILLSIRTRATAAFSLIEIVLAMAVISFALVGILGLFPVALQTATNSQRETQAALIARSIFSDLEAQTGGKRFVFLGKDKTSTSESASGKESDREKVSIDLTVPQSYYLSYDDNGLPLNDKIGSSEYGGGMGKAGYLAKITVAEPLPNTPPGISQLEITVGAPGVATLAHRTSYPFVSLLNNGRTTP